MPAVGKEMNLEPPLTENDMFLESLLANLVPPSGRYFARSHAPY